MRNYKDISAVILSSGNSSRMTFPKAFLKFEGNKTFLEKIVETYILCGIHKFIVIVNPDVIEKVNLLLSKYRYKNNIKIVLNRFGELGRFYSIRLGLFNSNTSYSFLQNIDNPFISADLLEEMISLSTPSDFVVPAFQNREAHPILLSKMIMDYLVTLKGVDPNLKNELNLFTKLKLDWNDEKILLNINTQDDYRKYLPTCKASIAY